MEAAGHLPSERQILAMFVDGLPTNTVSYVTLYDSILNSLNDIGELPNIHHLFNHVVHIENNLLQTRLLNLSQRPPPANTSPAPLPPVISKAMTTTSAPSTSTTVLCGNCGCPHATDKCFQPGGGIEGKREEVLAS